MTDYRLMDGASGRPGVGSSGTQPPASATSYGGSYLAGLVFNATAGAVYFEGYWWWVPGTNGNTAAQKFALWQKVGTGEVLVPGSVVTSAALTAGAWNYVALSTPLALAPLFTYVAATGFTSSSPAGFPLTQHQFGSGNPYASGITNGPLTAYPSGSSSAFSLPQSPFSTAGADPSLICPTANDQDDLLWLDVQVTDVPPSGATYRAFPNSPAGFSGSSQTASYTLGVEFSLTQACALSKIWHWSPSGSTLLPSRCGIWNVGTQTEVSGTDNSSPSWLLPGGGAASAGDGWVYCDYSSAGVTLSPSVNYKVSTFAVAPSSTWFAALANFWGGSPGLWSGGVTAGPLVIPGNSAATSPGQDSWNLSATWTYPATSTNPEYDGVDVEVIPASSFSGTGDAAISLAVSGPGSSARSGSGGAAVALGVHAPGSSARAGGGSAAVALGAAAPGASARSGSGSAVLSLSALASGSSSHRSGTGTAVLELAALATAPAPAQTARTGSWWGLYNVLEERAEYAAYYRSQPLVACPNDGTPLKTGPPESPEVELYCPFDGFVYPRDYDPDIHSGM